MNFFELIKKKVLQLLNPIKYAEYCGVNHGEHLCIYGKVSFGSEPWIITLGDNVHITADCKFITHDGGTLLFRQKVPDLEITKPIIIGNNVYIGVNVIILPGVVIGDNVIIGAGSVVTKNLESNGVYAGNPARLVKTIDSYFEKIQKESLHLGHLDGKAKDIALRKFYGYNK